MTKIKFFSWIWLLFCPVFLLASDGDYEADLRQRLPLYEALVSKKLEDLNNCRHTCIAHCRTANRGNAGSCGPATCDANDCSMKFEEYREARSTLDTAEQEIADIEGERQINPAEPTNPPPQNLPEPEPQTHYAEFTPEGESTVIKLRKKEKKLKTYAIAGGVATVVLGLHARKCCAGPLGGGGAVSPPNTQDVSFIGGGDSQGGLSFLNFMSYSLAPHLGFPLFSLVYSHQCTAIVGGIACPGPYPQAPQCPMFTALAAGAAVQTINIIVKRKKIKDMRRQMEVKPEPCQYDQESTACFCALHPYISGCNKGQANIPSECQGNPYSNACGRAICRLNPNSEDCISPSFHPSCKDNPEQCMRLAEVLNTCEGSSCQNKVLKIFEPEGGWPPGVSPDASFTGGQQLTPGMKEEIEELVARHVNADPTTSLSGEGEGNPLSGGNTTKENLSRQMNDVLNRVYGGGDPTGSLGGEFGGGLGSSSGGSSGGGLGGGSYGNSGDETSKSELADQMNAMLDKAYGAGNNSATFGGSGEWDSLSAHNVGKSALAKQMQKMLSSMYDKEGKNSKELKSTPLRMGEGYVGTKDDNIFFLVHNRHQNLNDLGYFIK